MISILVLFVLLGVGMPIAIALAIVGLGSRGVRDRNGPADRRPAHSDRHRFIPPAGHPLLHAGGRPDETMPASLTASSGSPAAWSGRSRATSATSTSSPA